MEVTMQVELNSEEKEMLKNALDHYLMELSGEIGQTDNADFRDELKREKEVLLVLTKRFAGERQPQR
jgi:hypothetical protein